MALPPSTGPSALFGGNASLDGSRSEELGSSFSSLSYIWQEKRAGGAEADALRSQSVGPEQHAAQQQGQAGQRDTPSAAALLEQGAFSGVQQPGGGVRAPSPGLAGAVGDKGPAPFFSSQLSASDAILNARLKGSNDGMGQQQQQLPPPLQQGMGQPNWSLGGAPGFFDGKQGMQGLGPGAQLQGRHPLSMQQPQRFGPLRANTPGGGLQIPHMQGMGPNFHIPGSGAYMAQGSTQPGNPGQQLPTLHQSRPEPQNRTSLPMTPTYATQQAAQAAQAAATNAALAIARQQQQKEAAAGARSMGNGNYWQGAHGPSGHIPQQQQLSGMQGHLGINGLGRYGAPQGTPAHLQPATGHLGTLGNTSMAMSQGLGSGSYSAAPAGSNAFQNGPSYNAAGGGSYSGPNLSVQTGRAPGFANQPDGVVQAAVQAAAQAALLKRNASLPPPLHGLLMRNGHGGGVLPGSPSLSSNGSAGRGDGRDIDLSGLTPAQLQMLISSPPEQVWRLAAQMGVIKRPQAGQAATHMQGTTNASQANYINAMAHLHQLHGQSGAQGGPGQPLGDAGRGAGQNMPGGGLGAGLGGGIGGPQPVGSMGMGPSGLGNGAPLQQQVGNGGLNALSAAAQQRTMQQLQRQQMQQQQQAQQQQLQRVNLQQLQQQLNQQQQHAVAAQANLQQEGSAERILTELGRTLARMGISVDAAVNAGLLGGLSVPDLHTLLHSHTAEARAMQVAGQQPQPQMAAQLFGPASAAQLQSSNQALQQQQQQQQGMGGAGQLGQGMGQGLHDALQAQQLQAQQLQQRVRGQGPGGLAAGDRGLSGMQELLGNSPTVQGSVAQLGRSVESQGHSGMSMVDHSLQQEQHASSLSSSQGFSGLNSAQEAEELLGQLKASGQLPADFNRTASTTASSRNSAGESSLPAGEGGMWNGRKTPQTSEAQPNNAAAYDFFGRVDSSTDHVLEDEGLGIGGSQSKHERATQQKGAETGATAAGSSVTDGSRTAAQRSQAQLGSAGTQDARSGQAAAQATRSGGGGHDDDAGVPTDDEIIVKHLSGFGLDGY